MTQSATLDTVSTVLGWIYFFAWSVSFYPQVILNFRRKSVTGLSLEFQAYNVTGFTFYTIYTFINYFGQREYGLSQSVEPNDMAFAVHALVLTIITVYQCFIYKLKRQRVHPAHAYLIGLLWILALYNVFLAAAGYLPWLTTTKQDWPYNVTEFLGYGKAVISLVKYTPQAYLNFVRKSTVGWSIGNVLLDLTGGTFSFGQQFVDSYNKSDWSILTGNIPKLLLSIESIAFDILFILQHYVLYRDAPQLIELDDNDDDEVEGETFDNNNNNHGYDDSSVSIAQSNKRKVNPQQSVNKPAPLVNGGSLLVDNDEAYYQPPPNLSGITPSKSRTNSAANNNNRPNTYQGEASSQLLADDEYSRP